MAWYATVVQTCAASYLSADSAAEQQAFHNSDKNALMPATYMFLRPHVTFETHGPVHAVVAAFLIQPGMSHLAVYGYWR